MNDRDSAFVTSGRSFSKDGAANESPMLANAVDDSKTPSERDVERFECALRRADMVEQEAEHQSLFGGSIFGVALAPAKAKAVQGAALPGSAELVDLVTKLVDKLWVKRANGDASIVMRLDMRNVQIPQTELRMAMSDGTIVVQFATAAAASYQHLVSGKANLLAALKHRFGEDKVLVEIGYSATSNDQSNSDQSSKDAIQGEPTLRQEAQI